MPKYKGILRIFVYTVAALMAVFLSVSPVGARQGCCSHHNGVCGCGCCDGSPLSSTCAPYYPECNKPIIQPVYPTWTPYPTWKPNPTSTPNPTRIPTSTPKPTKTPTITIKPIISPTTAVTPAILELSPTVSVNITLPVLLKVNTQSNDIGSFLSGILRGIFNFFTPNKETETIISPI